MLCMRKRVQRVGGFWRGRWRYRYEHVTRVTNFILSFKRYGTKRNENDILYDFPREKKSISSLRSQWRGAKTFCQQYRPRLSKAVELHTPVERQFRTQPMNSHNTSNFSIFENIILKRESYNILLILFEYSRTF